ncbi:MAG TPA: type II toxin-antitoxin system HicB family antitoxin [Planctomycetaceae bacterium]|nr:type II toxin-antitoxin system HicB family antitoxin [Planctomycetaceae bacterium]
MIEVIMFVLGGLAAVGILVLWLRKRNLASGRRRAAAAAIVDDYRRRRDKADQGLVCPSCGGLAEPLRESPNRYCCIACGVKFAADDDHVKNFAAPLRHHPGSASPAEQKRDGPAGALSGETTLFCAAYKPEYQLIDLPANSGDSQQHFAAGESSGAGLMRYVVVIERGPTSFGAYVPDLPGWIAAGESLEEVRVLISEPIELHLDDLRSSGSPIPQPSSLAEYLDAALPAS